MSQSQELIIIIRPSFMKFCQDGCRAAAFNHILYWIAYKAKGQPIEKMQAGKVMWHATTDELTEGMAHSWGVCKVRDEVNALIKMGIIGRGSNPEWGADRTKHFFFGKEQCTKFLELCKEHNICLHTLGLPAIVKHLIISSFANDKSIECICGNHYLPEPTQAEANNESMRAITKDITKITYKGRNNKPESPQSKKPQETQETKEQVPSPSFQQKNTKNVLSEKAQAIITLWEEIEGEPVLLTKKIIDAALALEKVSPTKEQLMECKYFCLTDNAEWYKTHGLDLASIANNWAKWRSKCKLTNANTTRASTTATVKLQAATPGSQYIVDELVSRSEDNLSAWLATPEGQKAMQEAEEEEQRHVQQALTITLSKTSVSGMQNFTFEPEPVPVLSNAPRTGKLYIKRPSHAAPPEQSADFDAYKKKRDEEERQALARRGISNIGQGQPGLYDPVW